MVVITKKRNANKDAVGTPKKLKAEVEQGTETPNKKGSDNGSPAKEGENAAADLSNYMPSNYKKKPRGSFKKALVSTPDERLEKARTNAQKSMQEAATYLNLWQNDKSKWKFTKSTQAWLLAHAFNPVLVTENTFETALTYFEEEAGVARKKALLSRAASLIKKLGEKSAKDEEQVKLDRAQRITKLVTEAAKMIKTTSNKKKKGKGKGAAEKAETPAKSA